MSQAAFDPYHLRPSASLNRRQIIALPGVEAEIIGKTGYEVASRPALIALIQAQAGVLGLENVDPADYPQHLNALLGSSNASLRIASKAVAVQHGKRVGYLIASILLSSAGLTSPLEPWEAEYLKYWREQVDCIVLGGGLSNGRMGQVIRGAVEGGLVSCGLPEISIQVCEHPSYLPLVGAARSLPPGEGRVAVVADFGGTRLKRGIAFYGEGAALQRLEILPSCDIAALTEAGKTAALAEEMIAILAETIKRAGALTTPNPKIMCSVAAYVEDGKPLNIDRGGYYALNRLSPDISGWFSAKISQASGIDVQVEFVHDCDAAAVALAGREKTAVLMLGSALGVGFVPPENACRPLAQGFVVDASHLVCDSPLHPLSLGERQG